MPQKPQPNEGFDFRRSSNLARLLLAGLEGCVTPFVRDRAGTEVNSLAGFLALVGMVIFGSYANDERVFLYVGIWMVALLSQRIDSMVCRGRGMPLHSRSARPYAAMLVAPFIRDEGKARLLIEPLFCLAWAWMLADWSPAVARLVSYAACSIVIIELLDRQMQKQREQAVIDSRLEMQELANGVRRRGGF